MWQFWLLISFTSTSAYPISSSPPVREPTISSNHGGTSDGVTDHGGLSPTLYRERCFVVYSCIISPRVDRSGEEQEQREGSRVRRCVAWFNRSVDAVPLRHASVLFPLH